MNENAPTPEAGSNAPIYAEIASQVGGGVISQFTLLAGETAGRLAQNIAQLSSGLMSTFGDMLNQIFSGSKKNPEPVSQPS